MERVITTVGLGCLAHTSTLLFGILCIAGLSGYVPEEMRSGFAPAFLLPSILVIEKINMDDIHRIPVWTLGLFLCALPLLFSEMH
jgi:hypothetical protein